jgi:hypothetical protein
VARGESRCWLCACVALAAALGLAAAPAPGLAQNSAEKPPPKQEQPQSARDSSGKPAKNSAEKPSKAPPAQQEPAAEQPAPPAPVEPAEPAPPPAPEAAPPAEAPAETAPTAPPAAASTSAAPGNVAESAPPPPAPGSSQPEPGAPAAQAGQTGPEAPELQLPNGRPMPPSYFSNLNAAEGRATGAAAGNAAEGGPNANTNGVAEPPEPPFSLPEPGREAGPAEGYQPPEIDLNVPSLDSVLGGPPDTGYNRPGRDYLKDRPLPPLSVDETDEEVIARNIEESLKQIDLTVENRPDAGIKIPLPSGVVTFKAADAFQFDRRNRILTFTGNAEIIFGDIAVWADKIEVNDSAATAYAKGYVAVQQRDEIIYADEMYLNYDTKSLELFYVEGNTSGPRVQGRAYYTAQRAYGTFDRLILEKCELTTCDPFCGSTDEYHLSAHKAVYKRNTSIVLHEVYIYVRSHKLGYIPILAMPLPREQHYQQQQSDVQQNYGYNDAEGFFAKFAYTYSSRWAENVQQPLKGVIKLDTMQNRGAGTGIRQDFYIAALGVTTIRAYYQQDWPGSIATGLFGRKSANAGKDFEFELLQELNLSRTVNGSLSIARKNEFVPSTTLAGAGSRTNTWANSFSLNYSKQKTQAALTANQNVNILGGTLQANGTVEPTRQTSSSRAGLSFSRQLTRETKFNLSETYSANKGAAGREGLPADQEGNLTMSVDWAGDPQSKRRGYTARLRYTEPAIDWDRQKNTTDGNVSIQKEMPSLLITLPQDLLGDGAYFNNFSIELNNLVTGRRRDPASIFRAKVSTSGNDRISFSRSSNLDTRFGFEQYWYDDRNAQYTLRPSLTYSYDTFRWFKLDAGWTLNFRQGVREPPVQSDRTTYSQSLTYGMSFTNRRSWRGQLRSGYNLDRDQMNPISTSFEWDPNRTFGMRASTQLNYAINSVNYTDEHGQQQSRKLKRFKFSPLNITGTLRSPYVTPDGFYNWQLNLGFDNDLEDSFRTTRLTTTYYRRYDRGWSTEIVGGFRAGSDPPPDFSQKFFRNYVKRIAVRKTNCCTTFEGGWRNEGHEVYVNMYLNALPQYPGLLDLYRYSTTSAEGTKYDYAPQLLFPVNPLINDILLDQFGITKPF